MAEHLGILTPVISNLTTPFLSPGIEAVTAELVLLIFNLPVNVCLSKIVPR